MGLLCIFGKHEWGLYRCRQCNKYKPNALSMAFNNMDATVIKKILYSPVARKQLDNLIIETESPFLWCIKFNMPDVFNALLHQQSLLHRDKKIDLIFLTAVRENRVEIVKLLLNEKQSWKTLDENLKTPLFLAIENNHLEMVKLLMTLDHDSNHKDINNKRLHDYLNDCKNDELKKLFFHSN